MLIRSGFGERLKSERIRLGLSQREMGLFGEVTQNTQRAYESGKRTPDIQYLENLERNNIDIMYALSGRREQENCLREDENELVWLYRTLPEALKSKVARIISALND